MTKRTLLLTALLTAAATVLASCDAQLGEDVHPDEETFALTGAPLPVAAVAASAHDGNVPANVLDGSLSTRWSCDGIGCWIRADLGATRSVTDVAVAWYVGNTRVSSYAISVSNDDVTYTQVSAGRSSGTTLQPEPYSFAARSARYVKLTVNGNTSNTWASVTELKVYGDAPAPAPSPAPAPATSAGPVAIAAVSASANDGNVPANVLDGSLSTRWSCLGIGCWIRADLGANRSITDVAVAWYAGNTRVNNYVISVSSDGVTYTQVATGRSSGTTLQLERYALPSPASARYVRVTVNGNTSNSWASITELRVYGPDEGTQAPAPAPAPAPEPAPSGSPGVDAFGTRNIYPSATGARQWYAKWSSSPRVLRTGQVDPLDPEFALRGSNHTLEIKGDGTARSFGDVIRLYVGDPTKVKKWQNIELTVYGKRVAELRTAGSTSGFEFETSTDAGHTSSTALNAAGLPIQCDGKAYAFAYRNDGRGLFQKELKHPTYTSQVGKNVWNGSAFPRNQWVGMKMVVYTVNSGRNVKLELWRDLTDGANGGTWTKVHEHTDAGGWAVDASAAASCGIPPDYIITSPQPLVILRNDQIAEQWYKKVSIREIQPQP
jgi:predicted small secreted protein